MTLERCDSLILNTIENYNQRKDLAGSLKTFQDLSMLAKANNWYRQEFLALNNIGAICLLNYSYGEALDYFNKAYLVATTHLKTGESKTALNNIAIVYTKENNMLKAIEYFKKALDIARSEDMSSSIAMYAINLGEAYNRIGEIDNAIIYLNEANKLIDSNDALYIRYLNLKANIKLSENDYKAAIDIERQVLANPSSEDAKHREVRNEAYYICARAYLALGDIDTAEQNIALAVKNPATIEQKIEGYQFYSDLKYSVGDFPEAFTFKDSVIILRDSLYAMQNNGLLEISKAQFELQEYRYKLSLKENQLSAMRHIMIISAIAVVILGALLWWGIRNNMQKLRQRRESEANKRQIAEQMLREKENEARLEQEQLKNQIELRNRQLAAKALYMSGRNKMIENIIATIPMSPASIEQINQLKASFDSDKEWNEFADLFEQTNNGLLLKLKQKHPNLNAPDLRFIIYVYMNLSNKEIASMLNITLDACRKRKERISNKLGLESSNCLHDYLFSL